MFGGGLGTPAWEIVIEECLFGEEVSFFALCDGETAIQLASAQDHKRVGVGDKGPNTGGMHCHGQACTGHQFDAAPCIKTWMPGTSQGVMKSANGRKD